MLRKMILPIAAGLLTGKAIKLMSERRYKRDHPIRSFLRRA